PRRCAASPRSSTEPPTARRPALAGRRRGRPPARWCGRSTTTTRAGYAGAAVSTPVRSFPADRRRSDVGAGFRVGFGVGFGVVGRVLGQLQHRADLVLAVPAVVPDDEDDE